MAADEFDPASSLDKCNIPSPEGTLQTKVFHNQGQRFTETDEFWKTSPAYVIFQREGKDTSCCKETSC